MLEFDLTIEGNISNRRTVSATDKFWGGSPSSRTPQGGFVGTPNYNITPPPDNLVAEHYIVRERIGSPAPRSPPSFVSPNSPNSPTSPPATEVAPPTPTSPNPMASPKTGPRRMAYATSKRYERHRSELALPTFHVSTF
ncbi:unnamed protein product [Cylicostephanus goldi]|uniref:Uncharacterized protein n=1 Tax=Cylicostephanus goldi TaxID=71465 RepID=A0A3P7M9I6_CYLGO|nr:unnamed protein product [Cylicostephanus goldi]